MNASSNLKKQGNMFLWRLLCILDSKVVKAKAKEILKRELMSALQGLDHTETPVNVANK